MVANAITWGAYQQTRTSSQLTRGFPNTLVFDASFWHAGACLQADNL